jgi:Homeodomain-like domain
MKRCRVTLAGEEREELARLLGRGRADVRELKHAQVLLEADEAEGGPGWTDERIVEALDVGLASVQRLRRRSVEEGFAAALSPYRKGGRIYGTRLDGEREAHLIALACSTPPDGHGRWSLRLLARRMVELHVDALSHETVRQTLKKTSSGRT